MKEIQEHKAYELLKKQYEEILLDYVILSIDTDYEGIETHKKAVIEAFNHVLFPDKEQSEVYRWNNEFSDYFDEGKEWWGTGLWTIFDKITGIMVVIGASLTD